MAIDRIDAYLEAHRHDFEEQLKALLRIPSISAQPDHNADTRRAAEFVRDDLRALGLDAELIETEGHPLVYAESLGAPGRPTLLVYGHYDVQPPEPLEPWLSPPFEPTVRDGNLYARGATDDKGQMLTHLKAAEAWIKAAGALPINVKFLIEGEEEIGGASLEAFVAANRGRLACDYAVISDTSQFAPGLPAITYGLKGLAYFEVIVRGANRDLHSGTFGGAVGNPCNALAVILASLQGPDGRIQVPGFYDAVRPLEDWERAEFAKLPFSEAEFQRSLGVPSLEGEAGYTTLERRWARPTCDVNGLYGGYQGPGPKTVLPCTAGAKLSFRLVPDQDNKVIAGLFRAHVAAVCPPGVTCEVVEHHGAPAVLVGIDSPGVRAAVRAIEAGFGTRPVFIREGGSIPVVGLFKAHLGVDTLLLGWGQNDDNLHGPNEKFALADFHRGIKAGAHLLAELAEEVEDAAAGSTDAWVPGTRVSSGMFKGLVGDIPFEAFKGNRREMSRKYAEDSP
jgi:acetylornithine deacetylase/succinyl-diaminopimelate desuccinylase-like protein